MNLLSPTIIARAYAAIHDVTDTFCRDAITVTRRTRAASLFNDDREAATTPTLFSVKGMDVPDKKPAEEQQQGTSDRTGGYVLCNIEDLQAAGLADAQGLLLLREGSDTLNINNGPELRIDKAAALGPLGGRKAVAKLFYRQELARNSSEYDGPPPNN